MNPLMKEAEQDLSYYQKGAHVQYLSNVVKKDSHLKVATVSPDSAVIDVDLSPLWDEVTTKYEIARREMGYVE